jgi:hypothetical protein
MLGKLPVKLSLINFREIKLSLQLGVVFSIASFLAGCGTAPPAHQDNICSIFEEYPAWYWDAKNTQSRWGIPISTQMAIIKQESHFVQDARPPLETANGLITWEHPTSAYGYSQALNGTWDQYVKETHLTEAKRNDFAYATDFIGWYSHQAQQQANISPENAYALYLAYHEGIKGYQEKSYKDKHWLIDVSRRVQLTKLQYANQLRYCENDIPKPSAWNLWFK